MHELKLDGFSVFFNTAEELDKFKAQQATLKSDSMTAQELRETLEATKASLTEATDKIAALEAEESEDKEAQIEEIRKEIEAELLEKAALLAETVAETGEKMDSLKGLTAKELLQKLTGVKDDGLSIAELKGVRMGQQMARKQNIKDTSATTKRTSDIHKKFGVGV